MKQHTTNYLNTFIEIAEDCPLHQAETPRATTDTRTVARLQFDLIAKHPYQFTSDDIIFKVYAERNDISQSELEEARKLFFSKGQPCLRASPLTKRYGFGIHANNEGKIALYSMESAAYQKYLEDPAIKKVKAMRTSKK